MTRGMGVLGRSLTVLLSLVGSAELAAQDSPPVLATVDGRPITLEDVDRSIEAKLRPAQQQI